MIAVVVVVVVAGRGGRDGRGGRSGRSRDRRGGGRSGGRGGVRLPAGTPLACNQPRPRAQDDPKMTPRCIAIATHIWLSEEL